MYTVTGAPLQGKQLHNLQAFLASCDLKYDTAIHYTVLLMEDEQIIATGSLCGSTIRCVAVAPDRQGEDLTGQLMTHLLQRAAQEGRRHLLLYTKPRNQFLFAPFGFYPVIRTPDCVLLENRRAGLDTFLSALPEKEGVIGCVVAHCNPFTRGHYHLIETAAQQCDWVHVFILSEDNGLFSPDTRLAMARECLRPLPNVLVHASGPYMVSSATFPAYFLKDSRQAAQVHCETDLRLFGEKIAPALHITKRFVGEEPLCPVTREYNRAMHALLPTYGVEVIEIPRKTDGNAVISASRVRALLADCQQDAAASLVPPAALPFILPAKGE